MTKYLLTVIFCLLSLWSVAQDSLKTLNGHIDQYERRGDFNGIITIAKDGKVFFSRSIGFANFQDSIKIDQTVSMPISSITKTFTAMAVMILAEQQKLGFDDFVMEYLENIPYKNVTIRHLLNHTSGLKRSYKSDLVTIDQLVDYVVTKKPQLSFEPGDEFQYSNLGYSLLAAIVQEVSGKSFETFLNTEIFQPLDLTNTFLLTEGKWKRPRAICYDKKNRVREWLLDSYPGATGIYSSSNDLIKWDQALYREQLVSKATMARAYDEGKLNDGTTTHYGFGWKKWNGNNQLIFQNGDWIANESILFRDIDKNLTIIIMANRQNEVTKWQLMNVILPELGYTE